MNRIYRRIWSAARQCWVVASEVATARGKASSASARKLSGVLLLTACTSTASAKSEVPASSDLTDEDVVTVLESVAEAPASFQPFGLVPLASPIQIGDAAVATGLDAIAIGYSAHAFGDQAAAFGHRAVASEMGALALGDRAFARSGFSAAIGSNAQTSGAWSIAAGASSRASLSGSAFGVSAAAWGDYSVALGRSASAYSERAIAIGYGARTLDSAAGVSRIAIGDSSSAGTDGWTGATSIGGSAKASHDSVAIGYEASTTASGAVALGRGSIADEAGTVSVGTATSQRRIVNIADGRLNATSSDAVTGRQLNTTNSNVTAARSVADAAKTNSDSALAKANTLSGLLSETSASGNVRLGASNSGTILDVRNSASANRRITGVADATLSSTSTDAVTGRQLNTTNSNVSTAMSDASSARSTANTALTQVGTLNGLLNQVSASGNVRVGEKNSGSVLDVRNSANANRKLTGVADGVVSTSSDEAVNGRQLNATNDRVTTVEGVARSAGADAAAAKTDAAKALTETAALGWLVAQVSASGDVRLGGKNSGATLDVRNSANANRKITGVADGILSASSAEAVSGSQLYSTNSRVSDLEDLAQFVSIGSAPFSERAEAGVAGVAVGNSAKTGLEGGTAVGTFAEAMGKNSTAIGRAATVSVDSENGFAMGVGAQVGGGAGGANEGVAIGAGARVGSGAHGSLALGNSSLADEEGVASFGGVGMQRRLVNIARGTADHNATIVSQLKDSLATLGGGASVDASGNIIAPTYTVQGGTQNTVEDALMALDGAVITAGRRADKVEGQLSSIFQDSPSVRADGMNQIALNGVNGMVLTNLADGRVAPGSRDAVNGGQLHSMQQQLNGRMDGLEQRIDDQPQARAMAAASTPSPSTEEIAPAPETSGSAQIASTGEGDKPTPQPKSKQDDTPKPQVDTAELEKMLARANEYTDGAISNFERRLDKMDKRFNRMAAMSSAQSAMAMNTAGLATYNRLGAGVGYSEGESAMAVGYQRVLNEKGSATFSLNGAFTNSGERSMGVGVGIGW
ncbi:ESPR-type extended signal peptide-containing protein [Stenotrophomonas sp. TD3]|uniref:ESPR-type extended signal peptide-containing protein n=1 Tax=Stenotrophomonas sp. TD3 TaxID=1641707 RepID=UPI000952435B|nr:ESPR-type extended signal peptide-containing protein [Stenotrophomonas sp. TD3]